MIPLRLTLSGFMSYRGEVALDFDGDSLWVLVGKNASGKSSIFDAVIFVLFGETRVKGIPNGELVNHHSDLAEISFDFAVGNKQYRVKRTIDRKGTGTRQASLLLSKPDGSPSPQPIPGTHTSAGFKKWVESDIGLNYEVFITSVLLRQGKADAFLEAGTETRYEVLSKLIDLTKYAALAERAREQRRFWDAQAIFHRDSLSRISPVTETDLSNAEIAITQESDAVTAAQHQVNSLQTLFGQASQWEHLNADLLTTSGQISMHQSLLDRSVEIVNCYQRLVDLRRVLPGLGVVLDLTEAIRLADSEIRRLSGEWNANEEVVDKSETTVAGLGTVHEQKASRFREITTESNRVYRRLSELSPVMNLIAQIEELGKTLELHRIALAKYPANLDELLRESEAKRDQLLEAQQAVSGLLRLVGERTKLIEFERRRREVGQQLLDQKAARPSTLQAKAAAQDAFDNAEAHEKNMRDALTQAITLHSAARTRMENFNQVAGKVKCQYCGHDLSEAHKAQEHQRLVDELEAMNGLVEKAKGEHALAAEALRTAKERRRGAADDLTRLDAEIVSTAQSLEGCERDIRGSLAAIGMTYDALPVAYQTQVCSSKPTSVDAWAETTYPQTSDLDELKTAVKQIQAHQTETTRLANQVDERNQKRALWTNTRDTLMTAEGSLPSNWKTLQAEHRSLSASEGHLTDLLAAAQQEQDDARDALEKAKGDLRDLRELQARRSAALETHRTALRQNQDNLAAQMRRLPDLWRPDADTMTRERLEGLAAEKNELEEYEDLHQQLAAAGQTISGLRTHAREIQTVISTLPAEACRPAEQVGLDLSDARGASRLAEGRLSQAQTRHGQLLTQRDQHKETESNMKDAARKAHLYGILYEQFGEKGIQKALINKAEVAIVRLSNQMLDNLSGGRSKLRLREIGGNKKALDLEVWDSQTGGDKPILASLASGSQRFRIAISLALGIGQYIGNESNRIESVIIDEGFGSLDREGRESIIQELYNLRQHLKRVILVSHQEEFSRGFSTGYEIHLVDGASQVKPLVQ